MSHNATSSLKPLWIALAVAGVLAVLWWHAAVLAPFAASLVLAYALHPAVDKLVAWRVPRVLAVSICLVLLALVVAILLVLLVPIVSQLVPMMRDQLPDLLVALWSKAAPWLGQWGIKLPSSTGALKAELVKLIQTHGSQWGSALWTSLLVGGSSLMATAGLVLLVPMLAFYWLADWHSLMGRFTALLPARWRVTAHDLMGECDELMGQYLRGQCLVMLILAGYYSVALSLAGFDLALPIGVLTGLAICIPYLGFGLGLVLAMLAGLLQFGVAQNGVSYPLAAVAVVYGLGQVIESFFLTPRLVGERIGLHPLGVILALMLFGGWMGLAGVVIALPAAAFLTLLGRRLVAGYRASRFFLAPADAVPASPSATPTVQPGPQVS
jgi:predicted PurR-regulated permease PerM